MSTQTLSAHFPLCELTRSQVAIRRGIDNTPNEAQIANLTRLCQGLLETVRVAVGGRPITVDSGFRNAQVNALVGGASNSSHLQGLAADVLVPGLTPLEVCWVVQNGRFPALDQCIFEQSWTHLSIAPLGVAPRQQFLTAIFKPEGVVYLQGIRA